LLTTETELIAIAAAANTGFKRIPVLSRYYFDYKSVVNFTVNSSLKVQTCSVIPAAIPGVLGIHLF